MNPKKLGRLANHKQEPWKLPLPQFIEKCYRRSFGKDRPDNVRSIENLVKDQQRRKADKKRLKEERRASGLSGQVNSAAVFPDAPRVPDSGPVEPTSQRIVEDELPF